MKSYGAGVAGSVGELEVSDLILSILWVELNKSLDSKSLIFSGTAQPHFPSPVISLSTK